MPPNHSTSTGPSSYSSPDHSILHCFSGPQEDKHEKYITSYHLCFPWLPAICFCWLHKSHTILLALQHFVAVWIVLCVKDFLAVTDYLLVEMTDSGTCLPCGTNLESEVMHYNLTRWLCWYHTKIYENFTTIGNWFCPISIPYTARGLAWIFHTSTKKVAHRGITETLTYWLFICQWGQIFDTWSKQICVHFHGHIIIHLSSLESCCFLGYWSLHCHWSSTKLSGNASELEKKLLQDCFHRGTSLMKRYNSAIGRKLKAGNFIDAKHCLGEAQICWHWFWDLGWVLGERECSEWEWGHCTRLTICLLWPSRSKVWSGNHWVQGDTGMLKSILK